MYPPCSFLLGRRFHFSVKKAKIQEHLAPRRSSPKKTLFIFHLRPSVSERARESEDVSEPAKHAFLGVSNRASGAGWTLRSGGSRSLRS